MISIIPPLTPYKNLYILVNALDAKCQATPTLLMIGNKFFKSLIADHGS